MAKPKKPKKLKYPKKPRAGASLQAMENYLRRRKEVDKENKRRESKYKSDVKKWESLKNKIRGLR